MIEIVDSLARNNNVASIYSDLISYQSSQFTILISVLCGMVVIIIGATCYWNFWGAKNQISKEISERFDDYYKELKEFKDSLKDELEQSIESRIGKDKEEMMEQIRSEQEINMVTIDAALSRIFALHCSSTSSHLNSADWWSSALESYNKKGDGVFTQVSAQELVKELKKCVSIPSFTEDDIKVIDRVIKQVEKIPDILSSEKKEAKKLLREIKSKAKKGIES